MPRLRPLSVLLAGATVVAGSALVAPTVQAEPTDVLAPARSAETVVLTGADLPAWSSAPAVGPAQPWPYGALVGDRSAHDNGHLLLPRSETGVDPDTLVAYRWDGGPFVEIPVQVDERFPYFLANPDSDFGLYSATDRS